MERKLEKVCKYKKQLKVGERYSLSNLKIFDYSFIVMLFLNNSNPQFSSLINGKP
jgi:hypothetical protein